MFDLKSSDAEIAVFSVSEDSPVANQSIEH
nr:MAG TPA: hypothetical protein [Caudoviricetes sp.]